MFFFFLLSIWSIYFFKRENIIFIDKIELESVKGELINRVDVPILRCLRFAVNGCKGRTSWPVFQASLFLQISHELVAIRNSSGGPKSRRCDVWSDLLATERRCV